MADRGLVTRGVNVRPRRRATRGGEPAGLRISAVYSPEGSPGRPLPGYRPRDFGLRTRPRRAAVGTDVEHPSPAAPLEQRVADLEAQMLAAQADVRACRAQGTPHQAAATRARALRARLLALRGEVVARPVVEQVHSTGWAVSS
jgi:hypothetical protein